MHTTTAGDERPALLTQRAAGYSSDLRVPRASLMDGMVHISVCHLVEAKERCERTLFREVLF